MKIKEALFQFMNEYDYEYLQTTKTHNYKNPWGDLVRKEIPTLFKTQVEENYDVVGSVGKGLWTKVPWITVFDKRITNSVQKGVYIVYLLNKDTKELYLTLNQGATDIAQNGKKKEGKLSFTGIAGSGSKTLNQKLKNNAKSIRESINIPNSLMTDETISTGSVPYDAGCICYKKYTIDTLPEDEELYSDLALFIEVYKEYYKVFYGGEENMNNNNAKYHDQVKKISAYIKAKGYTYDEGMIENFYLCLKSKPFVILAGISGTGKSKLVELFANACGADYENGRFLLVPVRPDWSDSTDLFGHINLAGNFVEGEIIRFIKCASDNLERPYFLCLDEMNLARVEYYFSDFLSVIETRRMVDERIVTKEIISKEYCANKADVYGGLSIPENLYVIGTVNMDETTFPFSKKVLDRANTIEFSTVNLIPEDDAIMEDVEADEVINDFLKTEYLMLPGEKENKNYVKNVCTELEKINEKLKPINAHVAYRVRDELVSYMVINRREQLLSESEAMDYEIMQKILPRLQGSSLGLKKALCELFIFFSNTEFEGSNDTSNGDIAEKMDEALIKAEQKKVCKYSKSSKKVVEMVRRYEEDGFTSYWT